MRIVQRTVDTLASFDKKQDLLRREQVLTQH